MSTLARTGFSKNPDAFRAGVEAARMAAEQIGKPDVIILLASVYYDHPLVLKGVRAVFSEAPLIGASTFGEMTNYGMYDNSVALMAIVSDTIRFTLGLGEESEKDPVKAGENAIRSAREKTGVNDIPAAVFISEMVGGYRALDGAGGVLGDSTKILGGCSSGDRKVPVSNPDFTAGYQYFNDSVYRHNTPVLLMSGGFSSAFGVGHGWKPLGAPVEVGRTEKNCIYELGDATAHQFYQHYLGERNYSSYPLGFYHEKQLILRAPTGITEEGGIRFTTEIPTGTRVRITIGNRPNLLDSARETAQMVLDNFKGIRPCFALLFNCISRRKMLGSRTRKEIEYVQMALGNELPILGCYCAGEFAPVFNKNFYHNYSFCIGIFGDKIEENDKSVPVSVRTESSRDADRVLIITGSKQIAAECDTVVTELGMISESVTEEFDCETSVRTGMPDLILLEAKRDVVIPEIREVDKDVQILLLLDDEDDAMTKIGNWHADIFAISRLPFRRDLFEFQIRKALEITRLHRDHQSARLQAVETGEYLEEVEDHLEVTEKAVMASHNEIASAHDYINNIIENMTDALIVVNPEGNIQTVNRAAMEMLECTEKDLVNRSFDVLFPEESKQAAVSDLENNEQIRNSETQLRTKNGKIMPVLCSFSTIKDDKGTKIATVYTAKDITERKEAELKINRMMVSLQQKTNDIQKMLQNMQQGLCTIDQDFKIHHEYSAYLEKIFETDNIAGRDYQELLFSKSSIGSDAADQINTVVRMVMGEDPFMWEINCGNLINEFMIQLDDHLRTIEINWDYIPSPDNTIEKIMLTLRDVTELRRLQLEAQKQKKELDILGQIVSISTRNFRQFLETSQKFLDENKALIKATDEKNPDIIATLFRNMHTIKGNARTYGFRFLTDAVHEAEQSYDKLRKIDTEQWNRDSLLEELEITRKAILEYKNIYESKIGRLKDENTISVKSELLSKLSLGVKTIKNSNSDDNIQTEIGKIENVISAFGTESLKDILSDYIETLPEMAASLGKNPPEVIINDKGVRINEEYSAALKDILMHLLRNSMDHGIESAEERKAVNKSETGKISITVDFQYGDVILNFCDDGRGLDLDGLKEKALREHVISENDLTSDQENADLIFRSGLSTAKEVTDISGRGVGMDAVKRFVERLGGSIAIKLFTRRAEDKIRHNFKFVIQLPAKIFIQL